jgi:hypothetical protein
MRSPKLVAVFVKPQTPETWRRRRAALGREDTLAH